MTPNPSSPTVQVTAGRRAAPDVAAAYQPDASMSVKLLAALPAAKHLLALGAVSDDIQAAYLARHPDSQWLQTDLGDAAVAELRSASRTGFDLVICTTLQCIAHPVALLERIAAACTRDARLVICLRNAAQMDNLEGLIEGDLSPQAPLSMASPHWQASPASGFKLLMDAGWMPTLVDHTRQQDIDGEVLAASALIADRLAVPRATASRTLGMDQLLIEARRCFEAPLPCPQTACFSVVVPTTRARQLRLNVEASPGLREVDATVVACHGAASPAEALEAARPSCDGEWVLLCHQDVYFPQGFGQALNALLRDIPADERRTTLIGFIGIGVNAATHGFEPAGFVIDRLYRADHPANERAVSVDELALVVARDSVHRIDPRMGWHLWATDLCLAAICTHRVFPRLVRLPLFHNSLNDYQLPAAFYDSAAQLLAKYPDFGPIPTLCGTIDARFLAGRPGKPVAAVPAEPMPPLTLDRPGPRLDREHDLVLDDVDAAVGDCIAQGKPQAALQAIVAGVHQHYLKPEFSHRALYTPQLDRRLVQLADRLEALRPTQVAPDPPRPPEGSLLIATELYDLGGHSRALLDVSRELPQPLVVITDLFDTYARQPALFEALRVRFSHADLVLLPPGSAWEKCRMLREATAALAPERICYFGHHQDPIPFVATLRDPAPQKWLFHHGDHNASLGNTLDGLVHVDFSAALQATCSAHLGRPAALLPMYVPDLGCKAFPPVRGLDWSVVSSGHPAKFQRGGPLALQAIVARCLHTVSGNFFHIGPLDESWVVELRQYLSAQGLDPQRFVHRGLVPSLWAELQQLDAACYLGSAPVGGGRAAIEAQGCGYPLVFFNGQEEGSLLANYGLYAQQGLGWGTLEALAERLQDVGANHAALSAQARTHYDAHCARPVFRRALDQLAAS
jgi:hypothetical protein